MNGNEVGNDERTVEHILPRVHFFRINDYGNGCGNALVAASRVDNHGKLAAAHTRVRSCRRHGLGAVLHAVAKRGKKDFADLRPIAAAKPFVGDGGIEFDLPLQNAPYVVKICRVRKLHNAFHIQKASIGKGLRHSALRIAEQKHHTVFFDANDVGMVAGDMHQRGLSAAVGAYFDVEHTASVGFLHRNFRRI